ncbi:uncharacterized protein ACLA_016880 [Aspergillus clavatus NRRL 1]|uniref:Uncharacterized protein n=1 Tax=Aspergillus clavatus (strain ATCC 1007 / CBS 513.65 / DSM 816 / NCTC 3887 / NRRL 1 / QM 1276 / 107) TaxID=344612 RepID=A1CBX4_ASPCL|nr:uncharacterized protein ACLA_016880 [Aspergillus clavatus NRRL 1]EAW13242.1 hypothetical protein ACLA_016880 [Aspergillus clavatus NRRL 1]
MASKEQAPDFGLKTLPVEENAEVEIGRLDELRENLDSTLKEDQEYTYEAEHSPFAEGIYLGMPFGVRTLS